MTAHWNLNLHFLNEEAGDHLFDHSLSLAITSLVQNLFKRFAL